MTDLDRDRLNAALELAQNAIGLSDPNPRVGCILGRDDGSVIATGYTHEAGGMHAEAAAIAAANASGSRLRGATAWVTLEPCAHHGRTPPCSDALVNAGVARVVVGALDPFAQVNGAGVAQLRAVGIRVDMADEAFAVRARELNVGFFSRHERGRPWVRLKIAGSLDGRTALPNGASQWITGPEARANGHAWRKRASAVMTGIGTVLADDPRLDVRHVETHLQPMRVVVDSALRIPLGSRVLAPSGIRLVMAARGTQPNVAALRQHGVDVVMAPGSGGKVDLDAVLKELSNRRVNELHVEAGPALNGALLQARLVDELLVYLAPKLIGEGRGMSALAPIEAVTDAFALRFDSVSVLGSDIFIRATPIYAPDKSATSVRPS